MSSLPSSKTLVITDAARKDLASIVQYTKKIWGEKQKKLYISQLHSNFSELCTNTKLGKLYSDLYPRLQAFNSQKHIVFYLVRNDELYIIRLLHQNMDIEVQLSKDK